MDHLRQIRVQFEQLLGINRLTPAHRANTTGDLIVIDDQTQTLPDDKQPIMRTGKRAKNPKNRLSLQVMPEVVITECYAHPKVTR